MKTNIKTISAIAVLLVATACTQEDFNLPEANETQMSIIVVDGGFISSESGLRAPTRTAEQGLCTEFTEGDACGLYVVDNGNITYSNVKMVAHKAEDSDVIVWKAEGEYPLVQTTGVSYFLYYPYQENMEGKVVATATDDSEFFAPLIDGWEVKTDQRDYKTGYSASDLMTALGTVTVDDNRSLVSFKMKHQLLMYLIELPKVEYQFANAGISGYITTYTAEFTGEIQPCLMQDGCYRYLVNQIDPLERTAISMSYDNDTKRVNIELVGALLLFRGGYFHLKIDGAGVVTKIHTLQVGDYYLKDGTLIGRDQTLTDKERANCIGIVVSVGHHPNDEADYSLSGIGNETCHGYVVALQDVAGDKDYWGPCGADLGLYYSEDIDNMLEPETEWNGYAHTQKMAELAVFSEYPAANSAVELFSNQFLAPQKSSGWFLPSIGQLLAVEGQMDAVLAVGGQGLSADGYWSSTECSDGTGADWVVCLDKEQQVKKGKKDIALYRVRPMLAF